jgi:hypothetical protein
MGLGVQHIGIRARSHHDSPNQGICSVRGFDSTASEVRFGFELFPAARIVQRFGLWVGLRSTLALLARSKNSARILR